MLNYPLESTKYQGLTITHSAFGNWNLYAGIYCVANSSILSAFHGYPYFGQQGAGASANLAHLNEGTVEFSFTLASTYNSGAGQVVGSFSISIWDKLTITSDGASIIKNDGTRETIISGLNIHSYIGSSRRISVKTSASELILSVDATQYRAIFESLNNLTNNIAFNVSCAATHIGYNFAANASIYSPGTIKITT